MPETHLHYHIGNFAMIRVSRSTEVKDMCFLLILLDSTSKCIHGSILTGPVACKKSVQPLKGHSWQEKDLKTEGRF